MKTSSKKILITGVAGFIGAAVAKRLCEKFSNVIGIDNLNTYYDPLLKRERLNSVIDTFKDTTSEFHFHELSIENEKELDEIFFKYQPKILIHMAAQAGVRYSIDNPQAYINSNLLGFGNILEKCRKYEIENFIYASSSSVYGANKLLPFKEVHPVNHPVSLYAATKKANELLAHSYSHLYKIPSTGLRFFTVYGPWGRPDMAPMIFTKSIFSGKPINIFNNGLMKRDFTYIDDVAEAIIRCSQKPATANSNFDFYNPDPGSSFAPHRIFNVGNSNPIDLLKFIEFLEEEIGIEAKKDFKEMQQGDVQATAAETSRLNDWVEFNPKTSLKKGLNSFVKWYRNFYMK
tara:strand:+ start:700 stop:1737 length:1038 start_codon:yes stop_codon:yes gene_type:complete